MRKLKGPLLLLLTTILWGLAFTAQSTAADKIGSFTFNAVRCILAAVFLFVTLIIRSSAEKLRHKEKKKNSPKKLLFGGFMCGITLFAGMNLQQFGIAAYPPEAASSGRAGFLTATYVVMIPIVQRLLGKKKFAGIDGIMISCLQFVICGAICFVCMMIFEKPDIAVLADAWLPIAYAGIVSSGIGYTLQILGQKETEPTVASIIMSLESVFAALFGWMILGEILSTRELIGCALVFASVIIAQIPFKCKALSFKL